MCASYRMYIESKYIDDEKKIEKERMYSSRNIIYYILLGQLTKLKPDQ